MLERQTRLTKDKEFSQVFKKGRSSYDRILGVKALKNNQERNRFGIIISSKVSKKAVVRNKIRRQLKEILRKTAPEFKNKVDMVIIVLPAGKDAEFSELSLSLKNNFHRLKLL